MDFSWMTTMSAKNITREFYFNVGGPNGFMRWGIYIFMFIAFFFLDYNIVIKVIKWREGKGELRTDFPEKRLMAVFKNVIMQAKILKEGYAGIMHASFFFGFAALFLVTMSIVVQEDVTGLFLSEATIRAVEIVFPTLNISISALPLPSLGIGTLLS